MKRQNPQLTWIKYMEKNWPEFWEKAKAVAAYWSEIPKIPDFKPKDKIPRKQLREKIRKVLKAKNIMTMEGLEYVLSCIGRKYGYIQVDPAVPKGRGNLKNLKPPGDLALMAQIVELRQKKK